MNKFKIEICKTTYSTKSFEVEAETEEDAIEKAINKAHNTLFEEQNSIYNIEKIITHKEDE